MLIYDHKIESYLEEIEHLSKENKLWEERKDMTIAPKEVNPMTKKTLPNRFLAKPTVS